jgi:hypothetical protein
MIKIHLTKCLLLLTEQELQSLLRRDPELWKRALQRGKAAGREQRFELPKKGARQ